MPCPVHISLTHAKALGDLAQHPWRSQHPVSQILSISLSLSSRHDECPSNRVWICVFCLGSLYWLERMRSSKCTVLLSITYSNLPLGVGNAARTPQLRLKGRIRLEQATAALSQANWALAHRRRCGMKKCDITSFDFTSVHIISYDVKSNLTKRMPWAKSS